MRTHVAVGLVAVATGTIAGAAHGATTAPRPCNVIPQITDPAGDGHHASEDVTAAWFSEEAGRLQAVIQVRNGIWEPAHPDSEAADFAMLFSVGGTVRYVRLAPQRGGELRYDHGTWTAAGGFSSAGPTTGAVTTGSGGTAVIDVPAVPAGTKLASPFVLTADGVDGTEPHWVDKAPGGVSPGGDTSFGADYVVGSCGAIEPYALTGVTIAAPRTLRGGGVATVSGAVVPPRSGVTVTVSAGARTRVAETGADGGYAVRLPIRETTVVRARAEDVSSQSVTITVRSTVTLKLRRRGGGAVATGRVRPALPGRVLLLRATAATPSAKTKVQGGRFRIVRERLRPGRYQAVYIPHGNRAVRSTSKTGVLK